MQIGAVLPQTELGGDRGALRAYAEHVESLGFGHVLAYDHVVGADPAVHPGWDGAYDVDTTFHEPFVMFGHLAALTSLELVTGIIILPQRQTALVAKQAAEVDLLTSGRFRLGVGVGWNRVEYEALGRSFGDRGRRVDEQIELLRALWTRRSVTASVADEHVVGAGLSPLPVQRPIPVWVGGRSPAAYRRVGRLADGWFPMLRPGPDLDAALAVIRTAAREAGRSADEIGMEGRVRWDPADPERFVRQVRSWRDAGATHLGIDTMALGLASPDGHLDALSAAADLLDVTAAG